MGRGIKVSNELLYIILSTWSQLIPKSDVTEGGVSGPRPQFAAGLLRFRIKWTPWTLLCLLDVLISRNDILDFCYLVYEWARGTRECGRLY
ncbi:hypothetical protein TNCV_2746101 [Trichonephila clavipes]|nr:hypothetical protein TNCV_2746101 [Trichonephila clavipes]